MKDLLEVEVVALTARYSWMGPVLEVRSTRLI
jgi:hypothetical protein